MYHALQEVNIENSWKAKCPKPKGKKTVNIILIGVALFSHHMKNSEVEIFTMSLYEIECTIEEIELNEISTRFSDKATWSGLSAKYQEFQNVFSKKASDTLPPSQPCNHKVILKQETDVQRIVDHAPLYKQTCKQLEAAKNYIVDNLQKGFIVLLYTPFAFPILVAQHPSGKLQFCIDYRKLNSIAQKDWYSLPLIDKLMAHVSGVKIFSWINIWQGFHQIHMDPNSEELTTFCTRYKTFKYRVMPFGLMNEPSTFHHFINEMFMDYLGIFMTTFGDNILIYSLNVKERKKHIQKVLKWLCEARLQANLEKCEFNVTCTKFLEFIVSSDGIEVDPAKTSIIRNWSHPKKIRRFNHFWDFAISIDSSSRTTAQQNYDIHNKELLAIVWVLDKWRPELEGLQRTDQFNIYTDHWVLKYFMTMKKLNARQACWAEFLLQFYFLVWYWLGKQNTLTDTLLQSAKNDKNEKAEHHLQVLLKLKTLNLCVQTDLRIAPIDVDVKKLSKSTIE